jgi:ribosomal protein S6
MFLIDNRQANRDWDGSVDTLKGILSKHGASILRCEKWGERKLAYEIKGRRRGTFVLTYFEAEGDAVNNIYRDCELSELILRALVLTTKRLPPEGGGFGEGAKAAPARTDKKASGKQAEAKEPPAGKAPAKATTDQAAPAPEQPAGTPEDGAETKAAPAPEPSGKQDGATEEAPPEDAAPAPAAEEPEGSEEDTQAVAPAGAEGPEEEPPTEPTRPEETESEKPPGA